MFNLPESEAEDAENRKSHDKERFLQLCDEMDIEGITVTGVTRLQASAQRGQAGATNVNPAPRPLRVRVESEAMRTKVVNPGRVLKGCPRMNPFGRFFKTGYDSARESGHVLPQREMETETEKSRRTRQPASQPPTGDVTETSRCVNSVICLFTCFYFNADTRPRNSFFLVVANFCYQVQDHVAKLILW